MKFSNSRLRDALLMSYATIRLTSIFSMGLPNGSSLMQLWPILIDELGMLVEEGLGLPVSFHSTWTLI